MADAAGVVGGAAVAGGAAVGGAAGGVYVPSDPKLLTQSFDHDTDHCSSSRSRAGPGG